MEVIKNKNKKIAEIHFLTDKKDIKNSEVVGIIKNTFLKCFNEIPIFNKKIAISHSKDLFIKNKMGGLEPTHYKTT